MFWPDDPLWIFELADESDVTIFSRFCDDLVDTARVIQRNRGGSVMRLLAHQSLVPGASLVERRVRRLLSDPPLRAHAVSAGTRAVFVLTLLIITMFVADFHARSAVSPNAPQGWAQIVNP